MNKIFSVENGDRGKVTVDGEEVKAVSCQVGPNGWAVVLRPDLAHPFAVEIPRITVRGDVRFFPLEEQLKIP